ncbi:hypothetical protein Hanom_Chr03g00196701 [Helianthus anomalus]
MDDIMYVSNIPFDSISLDVLSASTVGPLSADLRMVLVEAYQQTQIQFAS